MPFFRRFNARKIPHPVVFGAIGAFSSISQTRVDPALCFFSWFNSKKQPIPPKLPYLPNQKITIPPPVLNNNCTSIQAFFAANPSMENLVRVCADLSSIIYCVTEDTRPSKEILTREMRKYTQRNPILSELELVESWRDGAVFYHTESKLLFCVARGTDPSITTILGDLYDLYNDVSLLLSGKVQNIKKSHPEVLITGLSLKTIARDLYNDVALFLGVPAPRLRSFDSKIQDIKKSYPDSIVLTTGHSLGGAIAHDYALHHSDAYSIVFSPGGMPSDRLNMDDTWRSSNRNIVAFKPSNDPITWFFDSPGIIIHTEPTGHSLTNHPLVSDEHSTKTTPPPCNGEQGESQEQPAENTDTDTDRYNHPFQDEEAPRQRPSKNTETSAKTQKDSTSNSKTTAPSTARSSNNPPSAKPSGSSFTVTIPFVGKGSRTPTTQDKPMESVLPSSSTTPCTKATETPVVQPLSTSQPIASNTVSNHVTETSTPPPLIAPLRATIQDKSSTLTHEEIVKEAKRQEAVDEVRDYYKKQFEFHRDGGGGGGGGGERNEPRQKTGPSFFDVAVVVAATVAADKAQETESTKNTTHKMQEHNVVDFRRNK